MILKGKKSFICQTLRNSLLQKTWVGNDFPDNTSNPGLAFILWDESYTLPGYLLNLIPWVS